MTKGKIGWIELYAEEGAKTAAFYEKAFGWKIQSDPIMPEYVMGAAAAPLSSLRTCGEGHYEATVSGSSVFAPWVACIGKELAGEVPWDMSDPDNEACSYENTHTNPYGITPVN